jgi:hypothetical protein
MVIIIIIIISILTYKLTIILYPCLVCKIYKYVRHNLFLTRDPPQTVDMLRGRLHENILVELLLR